MKIISIGNTYSLSVSKSVDFGFYLDAENLGEVLLPLKFAPEGLSIGDKLQVFLYFDSEDRPIATTQKPKAQLDEFAHLEVIANTEVGLFLDWGLDKDLLLPFAEQHRPLKVGQSCLVYLYTDKLDGRIVASSKIDKFLDDNRPHNFEPQQEVDLIIANSTDLGFKAIINNLHWGVLYQNEVHQRLSFGQKIKGYIKHIRPDRRIDLSLQNPQQSHFSNEKIVYDYLISAGGSATVHDKSDPQQIKDIFGLSKSAFKKAIGGLYKRKIISINKDSISIIESK